METWTWTMVARCHRSESYYLNELHALVPYLLGAVVMCSAGSGDVSGLYLIKHAGRVQPASKKLPLLL